MITSVDKWSTINDENCVLLGYYAASIVNFLPTLRFGTTYRFYPQGFFWNTGDGTDGLSRNVGKQLQLLAPQ